MNNKAESKLALNNNSAFAKLVWYGLTEIAV
jgi:hypothetical protein